MRTFKNKRGFTLVELMIVVAIIGVLAALAIYGVSKYLTNAKTAEARNSLGQISKDAASAYQREGMAASVLTLGSVAGVSHRLCASSTAIPIAATSIQGQKYQSSPAEWNGGSSDTGWQCLKFTMDSPQYFQYSYTGPAAGVGAGALGALFTATANGDLNGDTVMSTFSIGGAIQQGTSGGLVLTVAPNIQEANPDE